MIKGRVTNLQAQVNIALRLPHTPDIRIECVVDTGFEGALTLPKEAVSTLGLAYLTDLRANLADDTNIQVDVHVATIFWNGMEREVAVLAMGRRPLIGTALLEEQRFCADFTEGGVVTVDNLG